MLALLLSLQAAPAAGPWQVFPEADGFALSVETASIQAQGTSRTFRMKMQKLGDPRFAVLNMTGDCAGRTARAGMAELFDGDRLIGRRDASNDRGAAGLLSGDAAGKAVLAFVCER